MPISSLELRDRLTDWMARSRRYPVFKGSSKDLSDWFRIVEEACEENYIVEAQWTGVGIFFISGDLKPVMEERQAKYVEKSGDEYWKWADFKDDIERVVAEAERIISEEEKETGPMDKAKDAIAQFRKDHPHIAASASAGLVVGGSVVLIPALGILALNAIGFTAGGVAAGSFAAALQSIFYGSATTGLFSLLQSIGATAVLPAAGTIIASVSAVGTGIASYVSSTSEENTADTSHLGKEDRHSRPPSPNLDGGDAPPPYQASEADIPVNYAVYTSTRRR
ncbi:hypothetical protein FA15DRAFT_670184 [Coprinopsis marcescibilis]|uniref:Uncharacterized protein n=1 Tax=Coprinopsis marcescibilis TaxID=230819 RepID=A0A5C3KTG0_COPMA|nr:hypothetical protein FA15DRAFT_670184 [Coprinopsis marcescibilis]